MNRPVRVALAQITAEAFKADSNRQRTCEVAREAFEGGANLVVLPELIVPGYVLKKDRQREVAEPIDGPTLAAWTEVARKTGGYISGGFTEAAGDRLYNTAVLVGPYGLLLHYRKLHLFDLEKEVFDPGDLGLPMANTPLGVIGICVCYDLRFVEVARALSLAGVELLLVPTAWVAGFDKQRWDAEGFCPQARGAVIQANLCQMFMACASQVGPCNRIEFLGSSLLATPFGKCAIGPMSGEAQDIKTADIDLADVERAFHRSDRIRPREDRRTDVYGVWFNGRRL